MELSLLEGGVTGLLAGNEALGCDVPETLFTPNSNDDLKYRVDRYGNPVYLMYQIILQVDSHQIL